MHHTHGSFSHKVGNPCPLLLRKPTGWGQPVLLVRPLTDVGHNRELLLIRRLYYNRNKPHTLFQSL
jgi:hypothetical protein